MMKYNSGPYFSLNEFLQENVGHINSYVTKGDKQKASEHRTMLGSLSDLKVALPGDRGREINYFTGY